MCAWKVIRSQPFSQIENKVIFIWVLAAATTISVMVDRSYGRNSARNDNNSRVVNVFLSVLVDTLLNITIWEFSWQLFNVSIEVDEKICRAKHKLTKCIRKALEIGVIALIILS